MRHGLLALTALAAISASSGAAEVIPRDFYGFGASRGRGRYTPRMPKGGNPAGTKLARKAARGKLGVRS